MLDVHRRLSWGLLPLILLLESIAWSGYIGVLFDHLGTVGYTDMEVGGFIARWSLGQTGLAFAGALVAGLLALLVGPAPVLVLGLLLASASVGWLAVAGPGEVLGPALLASAGAGMTASGTWCTAALPLQRTGESARNAFFLLLYGLTNVAILVGEPLAPVAVGRWGTSTVLLACAALLAVCAVLALPLLVTWVGALRSPERRIRPRQDAWLIPLMVGVVLVVVCALPEANVTWAYVLVGDALRGLPGEGGWLSRFNPALVVLLTAAGGVVFLLLARNGRTVPTLLPVGVGLVLVAPACVALLFEGVRTSPAGLAAVTFVLTLAEVLVVPLLLSRLAGDLHWRTSVGLLGFWGAVSSPWLMRMVDSWLVYGLEVEQHLLPVAVSMAGAVVGSLLVIAAPLLQRRVYDRLDDPPPDPPSFGPISEIPTNTTRLTTSPDTTGSSPQGASTPV